MMTCRGTFDMNYFEREGNSILINGVQRVVYICISQVIAIVQS
jgi:hypothetical protein